MKIHEHQAAELLAAYGVPTGGGRAVFTADEAEAAAAALGTPCVVKAQIHAGGRGKAGGVKLVQTPAEARAAAEALLGATLVTPQTGPAGKVVHRLMIAPAVAVEAEYYVGMLLDNDSGNVILMASAAGGMEIETVAKESPEKILRQQIDPLIGLRPYHITNLSTGLGLAGDAARDFAGIARGMYRLFTEKDCSLIELNPLARLDSGRLQAIDAKVTFDDNALFRHKDIAALRDPLEEDPKEAEAQKSGLSYVALDGTIACMVNGAGLAMATMDMIDSFGGRPANFLDVGGGASAEKVEAAFTILMKDEKVKGIFVNIFGGIMRCDVLSSGIVAAARKLGLTLPLVVRMRGTNAEEGERILNESGLSILWEPDLGKAARAIVALTKGGQEA